MKRKAHISLDFDDLQSILIALDERAEALDKVEDRDGLSMGLGKYSRALHERLMPVWEAMDNPYR
jgi:hypothetical protein